MTRVLIADKLSPRAVEIFKERGIAADVKTGLKEPELIEAIDGYDGLAVRSATKVTAKVLAAAKAGRADTISNDIMVTAPTKRVIFFIFLFLKRYLVQL